MGMLRQTVASINTLTTFTRYQYLHKRFVCHPHAVKQALPNPHEVIIRKLYKTIINHQYVHPKYSKPNENTLHSPTIKSFQHTYRIFHENGLSAIWQAFSLLCHEEFYYFLLIFLQMQFLVLQEHLFHVHLRTHILFLRPCLQANYCAWSCAQII